MQKAMPTKTIAIIGITGNQGASVADVFLGLPGWHVRGISRDSSKPSAQEWIAKGAEVVDGNLDDPATLLSAFRGAHVIFGVTDFWVHMQDPVCQERAKREGRELNEVAYDREVEQGCCLVDAVAKVDEEQGGLVERFVLSTLSDAKHWSKGKIAYNLHFDSKWRAVDYLRREHMELATKTSFLQLGIYATNWKSGHQAPQKQSNGTYKVGLPMGGDVRLPIVDPRADTGALTKALVELEPGKNLVGAGSYITWSEWCTIWGNVNGVTCTYERTDRRIMEEAYGSFGRELADMFQYMDEFGYDGGDPSVVYPWDLGIDVKVTSIEDYIKRQDWSSLL